MSEGDLRQRKRLSAMRRIQNAALDLFDARGYEAVTVEQIADASEVSASSVYRYFGTKEQLILWDEWDPLVLEALLDALGDAPPLVAARHVMLAVMTDLVTSDEQRLQRRVRHMMADPTLEAASARQVLALSETVGEVVAARLHRKNEDLEVQVFSHALVGGLLGALHHWHGSGFAEPLRAVLTRSFDIFERGLDVPAALV